jgi:hypothetical protein
LTGAGSLVPHKAQTGMFVAGMADSPLGGDRISRFIDYYLSRGG